MNQFYTFVDSNLFNSLVTLFVGGLAIIIYAVGKITHKRDAATLIIQEIRYAENLIRVCRSVGAYPLADKLLPTNNWNTNIHLFVNNLKESEIDLISRFYANAIYIDSLIQKISDAITENALPKNPQPASRKQTSGKKKSGGSDLQYKIIEMELEAKKVLAKVSKDMELVHNTPQLIS